MDIINVREIIKRGFNETNGKAVIPTQRVSRSFTAVLIKYGIEVDCLGDQPILPWEVFGETINLLMSKNGRVRRGDAMNSKLGYEGLELDTVEGYIAVRVYQKSIGSSVFRRISPISSILVWAGLCRHEPNYLVLNEEFKNNRA